MTTLKLAQFVPVAPSKPRALAAQLRPPLGWVERLAAWAERQPRHRHLGCWTAV